MKTSEETNLANSANSANSAIRNGALLELPLLPALITELPGLHLSETGKTSRLNLTSPPGLARVTPAAELLVLNASYTRLLHARTGSEADCQELRQIGEVHLT